jgi:hypothetical protein
MNVYGGFPLTYTFSETDKHAGGASYAYICEVQKDSLPQHYTFSSSFGGGARLSSFQAAGNSICANPVISSVGGTLLSQTIQEWRLGYETIPVNATASRTITLDSTGSGRNLLYIGTFAGTQPTAKTHLHGVYSYTPTATNAIATYRLFSTDDYFTQVFFTVRACVTQNADGTCADVVNGANTANGAIIPNGSYSGTVSVLRAIAGVWSANGTFNLTGQDIPGNRIHHRQRRCRHRPKRRNLLRQPDNERCRRNRNQCATRRCHLHVRRDSTTIQHRTSNVREHYAKQGC